MHSGGFPFIPSTTSSNSSSGSNIYPMMNGTSAMFSPPRLVNRLREFPLDLRYRPVLTPPSTPSPPRKRTKFLNMDLKTFEVEESAAKINQNFNHMNQFSSTISIDNKRYFQNSIEHVFPSSSSKTQSEVKLNENSNSNDFIDITSSDNEMENFQHKSGENDQNEFFQSESNLTEDLSNHGAESETSDEIVDIESNEDSVVFSELLAREEVENETVLESGKMFFDDPKLHSKALEGFAKLFDSSLYDIPEVSTKRNSNSNINRLKSDRKRVKSRKQLVDEETTSPVSGTIIRKLHEGEELVIRKGDIDPVSLTSPTLKFV